MDQDKETIHIYEQYVEAVSSITNAACLADNSAFIPPYNWGSIEPTDGNTFTAEQEMLADKLKDNLQSILKASGYKRAKGVAEYYVK